MPAKKKISSLTTFLAAWFLLIQGTCIAQDPTPVGADGIFSLRVIDQSFEHLKVEYRLPPFHLGQVTIEGEVFQEVMLSGHFLPNDEGAPNLPGNGRFIALPAGADARIELLETETDTLHGIRVPPAPEILTDTDPGPPQRIMDPAIYGSDSFYPKEMVGLSEPYSIRGIDAVMLGVVPFQYNPVSKTLVICKTMKIGIRFDGGTGEYGDPRLMSRWWKPILADLFLNEPDLPEILDSPLDTKNSEGCEYLIISPDKPEFLAWADTIRSFRIRQGITTRIIPVSEIGNTSYELDTFFEEIYNEWDIPPAAVLLLSDYGNDANGITSYHMAHSGTGRLVSDNIFADVNGDHLPDMAFARITAQTEEHLEIMVKKFIDYEMNPPVNPHYYNHPVTAMGWETSRWFQLCAEVINGFWEHGLGKQPVRENCIFYGTPGGPWSTAPNTQVVVDYFGQNGLQYIPDSSGHLTDWDGSAMRINNDLNNGAFMMQHRDHGFEIGWGEPSYTIYDITGLYNEDLTFIFSVNCLTGKFNWENECFAEAFHRHDWGALGMIAASDESFSFVNDTYVWGMYDYMWPQFMPDYGNDSVSRGVMPCFGSVAGKYFLEQSGWPFNHLQKEITYDLFHMHGDAFTTVYTEMPQPLDVSHDSVFICGSSGLEITADEGALISITLDDAILYVTEGTGVAQNLPVPYTLPENKLMICATAQNRFRYEKIIDIIPPDGPFVMEYGHSINDSTGNGNGLAENGEYIRLGVCFKNAGNSNAEDVTATITTGSPYISVIDSTELLGDIAAGQVITTNNAFEIFITGNPPDNHPDTLVVHTSDGTSSRTSFLEIDLHANDLMADHLSVLDPGGNNNLVLNAGETAQIVVRNMNKGSGQAGEIECFLSTSLPGLNIIDPLCLPGAIGPGDTVFTSFQVALDPMQVDKTTVPLIYEMEILEQTRTDTFMLHINCICENWESHSFDTFNWEGTGDAEWYITEKEAAGGRYSARSGFIIDEQESVLQMDRLVAENDTISFKLKTHTEESWDFLRFYIDTALMQEWSGDVEWTEYQFPVEAGLHTFSWAYEKDMFFSYGQDCAWLDDIVIPAAPLAYAGRDDTVCEGSSFQLSGKAEYYNTLIWSSQGDGYFENINTPDAIYHPGNNDIDSGYVALEMQISHNWGEITDEMLLSIRPLPEVPEKPSGDDEVCNNETQVEYHTQPGPETDFCVWSLQPANAGDVSANNASCTIEWSPSFSGQAFLKVRGVNGCGSGDFSDSLQIQVLPSPEVSLEPFGHVWINTPPFELTGGDPEGGIYTGEGVYSGYFYPQVAGEGTHTITYIYTNPEGCSGSADQPVTVDLFTGNVIKPASEEISITPNPTEGMVTIHTGGNTAQEFIIAIYNSSMKQVLKREIHLQGSGSTGIKLDLDPFQAGIYLVIINTGNHVLYKKLILY